MLNEIYDETDEVELSDELMLMGVDELENYGQASKEKAWRIVMEREMELIEKNETWSLTELPPGHRAIDLK